MSVSATATSTASTQSDAQKIANLRTAAHLVQAQMGIDSLAMDYDTRNKYNKALAVVITTYPARFTAQAVANAQTVLKKNYAPLEDTGFNMSEFGGALADNAVSIGNKIGTAANAGLDAVGNTFSVLKYALPVLVVGGAALYIWFKAKRA